MIELVQSCKYAAVADDEYGDARADCDAHNEENKIAVVVVESA